MELNQINIEYTTLKARLAQDKFLIDGYKSAIKNFSTHKIIAQGELADAQLRGDTTAENAAKRKISDIDKKILELQRKAESKKQELSAIRKSLDSKIKMVTQAPNIQKHFNEVMKVRCDRKLKKLDDKKDHLKKTKESLSKKYKELVTLQKLLNDHPTLANNFKTMAIAQKQISDLSAKLAANPGDATIQSKLTDATNRLNKNRKNLVDYIKKHKINVQEADIDLLSQQAVISKQKILDANGNPVEVLNVDINKTLKNKTSELIKKNKDAEKELSKIDNQIEVTKCMIPNDKGIQNNDLKWYQFAKKFKNWRQRRHQKAIQEPLTENGRDDDDAFIDSLKYDIVKDSMVRTEKQKQKMAQREVSTRREAEKEQEI